MDHLSVDMKLSTRISKILTKKIAGLSDIQVARLSICNGPVVFRPCLTTGLAFSKVYNELYCDFF